MCTREGLLDFENEEHVVFYVLSGQGSASPPSCCFGVSAHRGRTAAQPGAHLSPALLMGIAALAWLSSEHVLRACLLC